MFVICFEAFACEVDVDRWTYANNRAFYALVL